VLIRAGCKQEKICFIFDESNVLNTAFLERMNALLASGEVPGLFENADYTALMAECKDAARKEMKVIDSEEELYKIFCSRVQRNLHVVFTMNPANEDFGQPLFLFPFNRFPSTYPLFRSVLM
jgi:dynein heavy chain 1